MRLMVIPWVVFAATMAIVASADDAQLEKPLIDFLTLDYMSVTQGVWTSIESHADRRTLLARINDEHKRFFATDFGDTASLRHAYYVPNGESQAYYIQFIQNLQQLNSDFQLANRIAQLLTQNDSMSSYTIDRFEREIFDHAMILSKNIFEEVSDARFWNKGKSVRFYENTSFHFHFPSLIK